MCSGVVSSLLALSRGDLHCFCLPSLDTRPPPFPLPLPPCCALLLTIRRICLVSRPPPVAAWTEWTLLVLVAHAIAAGCRSWKRLTWKSFARMRACG